MAILKCKMCGGDLTLLEGKTTAECEYCGSVQTVPVVDDEKKLTLFNRANRLRAACEFDKAAGVYESIVAAFPEEAEAYWGLVLCKYGIEYVDDPATGKKIPTCHRSSFESVLDDSDFDQAMENADAVAQKVYREEAKQIERIRKGILEVSSMEQPYDIFICYKETDENGDRTLDSVLAQDLYSALTDKGYRVFFSRITLQGKLGEAYEPYIFAALNSAKVMLAIGTCYEYYNAVWVKNEWSRYLKICEADKSKHLIPCYKDLDPEDMPREFNHLQGADLGKMGAIQDILFNMEKYIPLQKQTVVQERVVVGGGGDNKIASLLDRGNMALEDGDWDKADSFFEDVLNNDSKNAEAYLGKALAETRCRTMDAYIRKRKDVTLNAQGETLHLQPNQAHIDEMVQKYTLAGYVREDEIRALYQYSLSYRSEIASRKQQYQQEQAYWENHKLLSRAEKFGDGAVAENIAAAKKMLLAALAERVKQAEAKQIAARESLQQRYLQHLQIADAEAEKLHRAGLEKREAQYQELVKLAKASSDAAKLTDLAKAFDALGDYQNSRAFAEHCRKRAAEEQAKLEAEAERRRLLEEKQERERKAKSRRNTIMAAILAAVAIAAYAVVTTVVIPNGKYNDAVALMEAGKYEEAIVAFEAMDGYKDSAKQIYGCNLAIIDLKYNEAVSLMEAEKYEEAFAIFNTMTDYKESATKRELCNVAILDLRYDEAVTLLNDGQLEKAIAAFEKLNGYKDSSEKSASIRLHKKSEDIRSSKVGDCITFGNYEQDNNRKNGTEQIEWIVLDVKDGKALLISRFALDSIRYNESYGNITWETCSLRQWLNDDFYNEAFSAEEKKLISLEKVSADKNPDYSTNPGKSTNDSIFALSIVEANKYFASDSERICKPTAYAHSHRLFVNDKGNIYWWLRSPGSNKDHAASISTLGSVLEDGIYIIDSDVAVRPVMWVDLLGLAELTLKQ